MRQGWLFAFVAALVFVPVVGSAAVAPVEPGGKVGEATLLSLSEERADLEIFAFCRPDILRPGRYERSCTVPHTHLLFLDCGDFETTKAKLDRVWREIRWMVSVDGRPVDLRHFGTEDKVLYAYPPAGGKNAYLRVFKVTAEGLPPGKHALRCVSRQRGFGTIDATWTFVVS
jgi:hypothetical protein